MKKLIILGFTITLAACSGSRPVHLGTVNTELSPCPDKPNCVSSLANPSDDHYIAPLVFEDKSQSRAQLKNIIENTERAAIILSSDDYIYAEYTSKTMGFVDDVEFLYDDEANVIQVRSASRLGYRDFDVNRERIENVRTELANSAGK